jgi:mRNA interferase HigB
MHVIKLKTLQEFWLFHPDAKGSLSAWYSEMANSFFTQPSEVKQRYPSASFLTGNRVVFNIKGNHYRLIVKIRYKTGTVFIRFIGTHADYDRIEAEKI